LDKDNNGSLSVKEARGVYERLGLPMDKVSDEFVARKMSDDDADGDGTLSFDEFMAIVDKNT